MWVTRERPQLKIWVAGSAMGDGETPTWKMHHLLLAFSNCFTIWKEEITFQEHKGATNPHISYVNVMENYKAEVFRKKNPKEYAHTFGNTVKEKNFFL